MSSIVEIQTPLPAPQAVLIGLLVAIVVTLPELWNIVTTALKFSVLCPIPGDSTL